MHFPSEEEEDTYSCTKVIAQDGVFLARPYLLLWRTYLYPLPGGQPLTFGPRLLLLLLCVFSHAKAARRQVPLLPLPRRRRNIRISDLTLRGEANYAVSATTVQTHTRYRSNKTVLPYVGEVKF